MKIAILSSLAVATTAKKLTEACVPIKEGMYAPADGVFLNADYTDYKDIFKGDGPADKTMVGSFCKHCMVYEHDGSTTGACSDGVFGYYYTQASTESDSKEGVKFTKGDCVAEHALVCVGELSKSLQRVCTLVDGGATANTDFGVFYDLKTFKHSNYDKGGKAPHMGWNCALCAVAGQGEKATWPAAWSGVTQLTYWTAFDATPLTISKADAMSDTGAPADALYCPGDFTKEEGTTGAAASTNTADAASKSSDAAPSTTKPGENSESGATRTTAPLFVGLIALVAGFMGR